MNNMKTKSENKEKEKNKRNNTRPSKIMKSAAVLILSAIMLLTLLQSSEAQITASEKDAITAKIEARIIDVKAHELANDYNAVIEDLKIISDYNLELCAMTPSFNAINYIGNIYEQTTMFYKIPGLWEDFGDKILAAPCQGNAQYASTAYLQTYNSLIKTGEEAAAKKFALKIADKYQEEFNKNNVDYTKQQFALEASKFYGLAGEEDEMEKFAKEYEQISAEISPDSELLDQLYSKEIIFCEDNGCSVKVGSGISGKKVFVKLNFLIGKTPIDTKYSAIITDPSGKETTLAMPNILYFTPKQSGLYYLNVTYKNNYAEASEIVSFNVIKQEKVGETYLNQQEVDEMNAVKNKTKLLTVALAVALFVIMSGLYFWIKKHKNQK
ncbi:MAG: hypothetical protein Q8O89_06940 [Nanoarchaeota archaeon]|nr:hypothetical protein [Nanoarchaeota archaeon]